MVGPIIEGNNDIIRPFEWLTSPASLRELLTEVTSNDQSSHDGTDSSLRDASSPSSKMRRALHVGSGSSTVGEFLVRELEYDLVLDVDKDEETLFRMKRRWEELCANDIATSSSQIPPKDLCQRLQHVMVDFTQDRIPQAPDASFSLVLDKSTLDCTLCSEDATAALLLEVYRCLAVNGVYILISFHEREMLAPLLQDLPGTNWKVSCRTMERQVENLTSAMENTPTAPSHHPPLNVLVARKQSAGNEDCHLLSMDEVRDHVHRTNDMWFRQARPLLTHQREEELRRSFANPLSPQDAYTHLFTELERENLEFDYFMEDWKAFCESHGLSEEAIDYNVAIDFLQEMQ